MWEGSKIAKPRPREALLADGGADYACMGVGWGKALGRSGNWGWDHRMECEFILLGAQLFMLIFPSAVAYSLSWGSIQTPPPSLLLSWGRQILWDTVLLPALTTSVSCCSKLKRDKKKAGPQKKCLPHPSRPLCALPWVTGS